MSRLQIEPGEPVGHALSILAAFAGDVEIAEGDGAPRLDGAALDPIAIARALAPGRVSDDERWARAALDLIEGAVAIGAEDDQAGYEQKYAAWVSDLERVEAHLAGRRFATGPEPRFDDLLLFAFAVRLDGVWFALLKANRFLLEDLPALHGHARDLFELPEVHERTDLDAIVAAAHRDPRWEVLNPRGLVPAGGRPDLDAPHFRDELVDAGLAVDASVEEDPDASRATGEFVRGQSGHRGWVGTERFPAEPGRYHLFAPYNCPWSHRALLGRSVKGLHDVIGATVVYFRRHPERGWQMNPAIPGCTEDPVEGHRFVKAYYEAEGSSEKSVPILYDTETARIVNNESAELLRMFDDAFGALATRDLRLYPPAHRAAIDRINEHVYQRINNGAYKAGFARSQHAYERAFARYFAALRWLDGLLEGRDWLVGSDAPTEADLRLFPTVFRHDAVYYARFRLNAARVRDYPRLAAWLDRMLAWPGVADASNLDHARNGYYGRTGNEIVPAGPLPLGLSPKDFTREVWLGDG